MGAGYAHPDSPTRPRCPARLTPPVTRTCTRAWANHGSRSLYYIGGAMPAKRMQALNRVYRGDGRGKPVCAVAGAGASAVC
jgi:hypothetical protein